MNTTRVLVIGQHGQLARSLGAIAWPGDWSLVFLGRTELADASPLSLMARLDECHPDLIINTAAYTAVDRAERERGQAYSLNAELPMHLAKFCAARRIPLLHVSTDYVFDGTSAHPLDERAAPRPLSLYGITKLSGEEAIRDTHSQHVILRTSWLFGQHGTNFFTRMMDLAEKQECIVVVDDQWGGPTPSIALAAAIRKIAVNLLIDRCETYGTFHFAGCPQTTWFHFAEEIMTMRQRIGLRRPHVLATTSDAYAAEAIRPKYTYLHCDKIRQLFQIEQPNWKDSLLDAALEYLGMAALR